MDSEVQGKSCRTSLDSVLVALLLKLFSLRNGPLGQNLSAVLAELEPKRLALMRGGVGHSLRDKGKAEDDLWPSLCCSWKTFCFKLLVAEVVLFK